MVVQDVLNLSGCYITQQIRVIEPVAQGGFGLVYRAHHEALGVDLALKVFALLRIASENVRVEAEQLFIQERRLVAKLQHPAIVKPYDAGFVDFRGLGCVPWLALEWLDGSTLTAIQQDRGYAPWRRADVFDLLRPVCEALAEAHDQGIAHRDISPNNLFVCGDGHARRVRLIDFGIAKVVHDRAWATLRDSPSQSGIVAFAPKFPAPEQFLHAATGPWTDVHALGLLASYLLTGRFPFDPDLRHPVSGACAPRRPTPGRFGVDVGAWEPVIAKALSLDPAARFRDAQAFLDALSTAEATERQSSPPARSGAPTAHLVSFSEAGAVVQHNVGPLILRVGMVDIARSGARIAREASVGALTLRFMGHQDQLVLSASGGAKLYSVPHDRATKGDIYLTPGAAALSVHLRHPLETELIELRCHTATADVVGTMIPVDDLRARFDVPSGTRIALVYRKPAEAPDGREVECFYVKW